MNFDTAVQAVQAGDAKQLARILEQRPDLAGRRTSEGVSLYMIAAYHRQPALSELVRSHLKILDCYEATAGGELDELVRCLDNTPESLHGWSPDGFNLPQLAAFFDQPLILKELLRRSADVNQPSHNPMRIHAVNAAAASGAFECLELLLRAGADGDATQQHGITPLMSAAHRGDQQMCDLLMEHGVDASRKDDDGKSAADFASEAGFEEIAALLRQ